MFIFNGISSKDMDVIEKEEDFIARAAQRYEKIEIEGKNGAEFEEQGYSVVEKTIELQILDVNKIDKILSWLNGTGILEYKGRITTARFYSEISLERIASIKKANVTFIRNPFWTKKRDEYIIVTDTVFNEGNIYSKPVLRLEKNTLDSIEVTVNNVRFKYNFNNESYVEIDCEKATEKYNNLNRSRQIEIGYEYPTILPGLNKITHSGDATIKIKRKDSWL